MPFALGQRWISDSESELGLGTIVALEGRTISVLFPANGENRVYARQEAPITRVRFNPGDQVNSAEGWSLKVQDIEEVDGILLYVGLHSETGELSVLKETFLDHNIRFNKPQDRLFAGQIDRFRNFELRYDTLKNRFEQQRSELRGLQGPRVSLIPHQFHIAQEVAARYAPRVLLADEVGLGKTIEAGLILHQQLITGRAKRVLIVVPGALLYQWLVEMLRRFNLQFSIFDEERCNNTQSDTGNPFDDEQLVLCSLDYLTANPNRAAQVNASQWDLLVVDEAHHLIWDEQQPSNEYSLVEALATTIPGVLLLTATPEQLGHESHFARLRLLDPSRYHDYQDFIREESTYKGIAELAAKVIDNNHFDNAMANQLTEVLSEQDIEPLISVFNSDSNAIEQQQAVRAEILQHLVDRHGTGRILFRNTRSHVKGFPVRLLESYPLHLPQEYQELSFDNLEDNLRPHIAYQTQVPHSLQNWFDFDPRIDWLLGFLSANKRQKVLLICKDAATAMAIEDEARTREGIRGTVFHEGMSILERDKAAAYFAQDEAGAQLMVCSEIGSEGRNFQFSHHLVMFDLPEHPDLLEQRIGRLDRIGQEFDVQIHVPYFEETGQAALLRWYHEGINAFESSCATGANLFQRFQDKVFNFVENKDGSSSEFEALIKETKAQQSLLKTELESGRDRLLEISSAGRTEVQPLLKQLEKDQESTAYLSYILGLFDVLGIHQDDLDETSLLLRPGEHMLVDSLHSLPADGVAVTFSRDIALAREELSYLSWEHPLIISAMDAVLSTECGSTSVALLKNKALPLGSFFVECIYTSQTNAPANLAMDRFLGQAPLRILLDQNGRDLSQQVAFATLHAQLSPVNRHIGTKLVAASQAAIFELVSQAELAATTVLEQRVAQSQQELNEHLDYEIQRLEALQAINPSIRSSEIVHLQDVKDKAQEYLNNAQLKLEGLRFVIVSHQ
ncbi:RNA polymerase-associated protein RapA [Alginatibacterium sediminis]|uniref:RNA polymerase-associated protein RapA n=1 Tax=Alginatibacterium sediminis TaxID=2164068 RepID=A0A420E7W4_9ALTE|nr:RNA polymerase-associated protein RapA [Alginatibacterium sediminis]RKF14548.1 RNA polymerase-associated protein RapA [Alginatibacterium sediminis]